MSTGKREARQEKTIPVERVYEVIRNVIQVMKSIVDWWIKLREEYSDVIEMLMSAERFNRFVEMLNDEEAGRLLKLTNRIIMLVQKFQRLTELNDEDLRKLSNELDALLRKLDDILKKSETSPP